MDSRVRNEMDEHSRQTLAGSSFSPINYPRYLKFVDAGLKKIYLLMVGIAFLKSQITSSDVRHLTNIG